MDDISINTSFLNIFQHTYWKEKGKFQLVEDIYEQWVVFAVEDGSFEYEIDMDKGTASFGDLVFCPPNTIFKRKIIKPLTFHFFRFTCNEFLDVSCPSIRKMTIRDLNRLRSSLNMLKALAYEETEQYNSWKSHFLIDIWQLHRLENSIPFAINKQNKWMDHLMIDAKNYITEHALDSDIQIKEVASRFGLSPVQFTRRFHTSFNVSPSEYLTSLRLRKAQSLLLETNKTIEDIAEKCGYKNGFYFSRRFSKKLNISPSEYRKNNKL